MRILIYILLYIVLTLKLYSEPIKIISDGSKTELCSNQELIIKWSGTVNDYKVEVRTEIFPEYRTLNFYKIENNTLSWILNDKELLNSRLTIKISDRYNPSNYSEISDIYIYQQTEIIDQTKSTTVCKNDFVYLRIDAIGFGLTYQWYKDGDKIEGANSNIFSINESDYSHSGTYLCKIISTGKCGVVESQPISVYVATATKFTTAPEEVFWEYNKPISMTATVHSNNDYELNNIKFKWFKDTVIMTVIPPNKYKLDTIRLELKESKKYIGVKSQDLVVTGLVWGDRSTYYCVATGLCGSDTTSCVIGDDSRFEVVKVSPDYYDCEGQDVVFKAKVVTNVVGTFTYQWYKIGFKILDESAKYVGTKTPELTIKNPNNKDDQSNYYVVATWVEKKVSKRCEHFVYEPQFKPKILIQPLKVFIIGDPPWADYPLYGGQTHIYLTIDNVTFCKFEWIRKDKFGKDTVVLTKYGRFESNYFLDTIDFPGDVPVPRLSVPGDTGIYVCKITNDCGTTWSDTSRILMPNKSVTACEGNNIELSVFDISNMEGNYTYKWISPNGNIVKNNPKYSGSETNKLVVKNITWADMGYKKYEGIFKTYAVNINTGQEIYLGKTIIYCKRKPEIYNKLPEKIKSKFKTLKKYEFLVATNGPELNYQLYKNNQPLGELKTRKLSDTMYYIESIFLGGDDTEYESGTYFYKIWNDCGLISSELFEIEINGGIVEKDEDDVNIINSNDITDVFSNSDFSSEFLIYPNPASDFITITLPENSNHILQGVVENEQDKVQIFNTLGIEVGQSSLIDDKNRIDISHLPAGVYFVRIGERVEKFVKI